MASVGHSCAQVPQPEHLELEVGYTGMPSCEELVFLDSVLGVRDTVLVNVSLFYKKHRLTVRHELFDVFDLHNTWTFNGLILRIF